MKSNIARSGSPETWFHSEASGVIEMFMKASDVIEMFTIML